MKTMSILEAQEEYWADQSNKTAADIEDMKQWPPTPWRGLAIRAAEIYLLDIEDEIQSARKFHNVVEKGCVG